MKRALDDIVELINDSCTPRTLKNILYLTKEELENQIYRKNHKEENKKKAIEMSKEKKNVQFGCGNHLIDGYINVDIVNPADIIWDVRYDLPFNDRSIKQIFTEHMLEHIDFPTSVNIFLAEAYRVLETGGKIIIGVPDCSLPLNDLENKNDSNRLEAIDKWYNHRTDVIENMNNSMDYLNYVMRDQLFHEVYHAHFWGYTKENLTELLTKNGFKNIEIWKPDMQIINPKRLWGTLYLKGEK